MKRQFSKKTPSAKHFRDSQAPDSQSQGELRIIGGKWRSRKLAFPAVEGLRPSPSRVRETLFNWLTPILPGSHCLDLFAGSGALGFEALSRGASSVTMVEQNKQVVSQLIKNKDLLNAEDLTILKQDACDLSSFDEQFDIVFCDPPFNASFIQPLSIDLHEKKLLKTNAKVYIETEKKLTQITIPASWLLLKEKVAGDVRSRLFEIDSDQGQKSE